MTGLANVIAMTTGLSIIAVPTTYAGSEATVVSGLTEGAKKTTGVERSAVRMQRSLAYSDLAEPSLLRASVRSAA
jgi:alcohol dehydrogenase class IV